MTILILFVAGFLGGSVNTLAGGGSFIVFPALMAAGLPPIIANASNTYAALPGYVSGALGLWKYFAKHKGKLLSYSLVSLLGGYLGADLLLRINEEQFAAIIPWLMLFAVVLFIFGQQINAAVTAMSRGMGTGSFSRLGPVLLLVLLALISVYGGLFNAGLGILLLAFLALAGFEDIHAMNGLKLWISTMGALASVLLFALRGSIAWYEGSIALAGVVLGGYVAARNAHLIPRALIRWAVIVYGVALTAYFFWRTYAA